MNKQYIYYISGVVAAVVVSAILAWFIFSGGAATPTQNGDTFGSITDNAVTANNNDRSTDTVGDITQTTGTQTSQQKIFKISDGPVAGATLVQTFHPTTTLARFVMADNGHVFDLVLDQPGAVPKPLSNTTIPGAMSALWVGGGAGAILQYIGAASPKTVYLGFTASSTAGTPVARLQFYPDGIVGLAASPDGSQAAYLLRTVAGTNGFVAKTDGTGGKLLFSLPLAQVQLRWPSQGTLLAYSNAAAGVPGIAFAIDAKTGAVTPLVYAPGLTATADLNFSHVLYQTVQPGAAVRTTYIHDVAAGTDRALSFDPFPERCVQSPLSTSVLYCAVPLTYVASDYLDLWHQGAASAPDSLFSFNLAAGTSTLLASPGDSGGGKPTDMLTIAVSPDAHYLLFISKYDRSLWGVRL